MSLFEWIILFPAIAFCVYWHWLNATEDTKACPECGGKGYIHLFHDVERLIPIRVPCHKCYQSGKVRKWR